MRRAEAGDIQALEHWDEMPHVKEATSEDGMSGFEADWAEELAPREDGCEFWIAEVGGRAIGAMQIIDPARERTHYWGEIEPGLRAFDIWIGEADMLGQGWGTEMMKWAIARALADDDVEAILVDPLANNARAHRFYERLGFRFVERRVFDEDECCIYRLDRPRSAEAGPVR